MPQHVFRGFLPALLLCLLVSFPLDRLQAEEPLTFESEQQEDRFEALAAELRCLVCQNQSLADSDAILAQDLRREVHDLMLAGKTNDEIKQFLVSRYGDFVLYRPPVKGNTLLLWVAPILLLAGGAFFVGINVNRRRGLLEEEDLQEDERLAREAPPANDAEPKDVGP